VATIFNNFPENEVTKFRAVCIQLDVLGIF